MKITQAPTNGLKAKYRDALKRLEEAFETLELAGDQSDLPSLKPLFDDSSVEDVKPTNAKEAKLISNAQRNNGLEPEFQLPTTNKQNSFSLPAKPINAAISLCQICRTTIHGFK